MITKHTVKPALRRYTDLDRLLDIVKFEQLTLRRPSKQWWDDKNDFNFLETYAKGKSLNTCVVLCFCERSDLYHHWRIFTPGLDGVCIEFDKLSLLKAADEQGIIHGKVEYFTNTELKSMKEYPDKLPFMKRTAFKDEREYRFVYFSKKEIAETKILKIDFKMIERVIVNSWSSQSFYDDTVKKIKELTDYPIKVEPSHLTDHPLWREYALKCL